MLLAQFDMAQIDGTPCADPATVPVGFLDDEVCGVNGLDMTPTAWYTTGQTGYDATIKAAFGLQASDVLYVHVSQQYLLDLTGVVHAITDGVYLVDRNFGTGYMRPVTALPAAATLYVAGFAPLYPATASAPPALDKTVNDQVINFLRAMTEYESGDRALAQSLLATIEAEIVQEETLLAVMSDPRFTKIQATIKEYGAELSSLAPRTAAALAKLQALVLSNNAYEGTEACRPKEADLAKMKEMVENLRRIQESRASLGKIVRPAVIYGGGGEGTDGAVVNPELLTVKNSPVKSPEAPKVPSSPYVPRSGPIVK